MIVDPTALRIPDRLFEHLLLDKAKEWIASVAQEDAIDLFADLINKKKRSQLGGFHTICVTYHFDVWLNHIDRQEDKRTSAWRDLDLPKLKDRVEKLRSGEFWQRDVLSEVHRKLRDAVQGQEVEMPDLSVRMKLELARFYMDEVLAQALQRAGED